MYYNILCDVHICAYIMCMYVYVIEINWDHHHIDIDWKGLNYYLFNGQLWSIGVLDIKHIGIKTA